MNDIKWSNRYDRFGYVQRGYDSAKMYNQVVETYRDWLKTNASADRSNASTNPCTEIYMEPNRPKPDRRILLALG